MSAGLGTIRNAQGERLDVSYQANHPMWLAFENGIEAEALIPLIHTSCDVALIASPVWRHL